MFKLLNFFLLFFLIFLNVNCDIFEKKIYFDTIKNNQNAFNFYNPDFDQYLNIIGSILNEPINITSHCINDLNKLKNSLIQKEEWALKVYESNGKPKSGFLSGLNHNLGNLDLCVYSELNKFDNQFCLISLRSKKFFENVQKERTYKEIENSVMPLIKDMVDFNFGTVIGTCLPLSCDVYNVASIINRKVLKNYELEAIPQKKCSYKNDTTFYTTTYYVACLIVLILSSLSISTLFIDIDFLKPFSIKDNFNYIYYKESKSEENFLAGFKVVYMFLSIPAHFFGLSHMVGIYSFSSDHIKEINLHFNWIVVEVLEKLTFGIDFMIFYGGFMAFLLSYDRIKNKKLNFIKAFIFLPIANWPILIGFISLCFVFTNSFNGPFLGDATLAFHTIFYEKGWKIFGLLSNTDYLPEQIIVHNWFNSLLFQLFIISYFVLYVFTKNAKLGFIISILMISLNFVHLGYIMIAQNIPPFTHLISGDSIYFGEFAKDYFYWYNHLDVYLVGLMTAYLYRNNKVSYLRNSFVYYSLFIVSFLLFVTPVSIPILLNIFGLTDNIYCQLFYFSHKRFFFSLFLSFTFLSFKAGYMVTLKNALSWKVFVPLSRLASPIIACQFFYFFYSHFTRRELIRFTPEILIKESLIILVVTFIAANVFYLLIEAPLQVFVLKMVSDSEKKDKPLLDNESNIQKDLNDNQTNEKDLNSNTLNEHLKVN